MNDELLSVLTLAAGGIALVWAAIVLAAYSLALVRAANRNRARFEPEPGLLVHVLRPCAGEDPSLFENLVSIEDAELGLDRAQVSVTLSVARPDDPAIPVLEDARAHLEAVGFGCRVCIVEPEGENQKVAQLAAILDEDEVHDVAVNIDSDVDLDGLDMRPLLGAFTHKEVGATWMPAVETVAQTPGDKLSQAFLGASLHSFPVLAGLDPGTFVGKVFAVRHTAAHAIGGFAPLADYLGEDFELGRRMRALGWQTMAVAGKAHSTARGRTVESVVARYARWLAVVRFQRPMLLLTYPLVFCPTVFILALAAFAAIDSPILGLGAAGVAIAARTLITVGARGYSGTPSSLGAALVRMPSVDLLCARTWMRALSTRTVTWRGRTLRLDEGGRLVEA